MELVPAPFASLLRRMLREHERERKIFDLPERKFWQPPSGLDFGVAFHGRPAANPLGPAAGPQDQMAQNIVLAWLAGSRILELKTVQVNDRLVLPRPCIDATNVGYNVEWSQELRLQSVQGAGMEWLVGLFYVDGDDETNYYVNIPAFGAVPLSDRHTRDRQQSLAAFGQASWRFGDAWRLSAGARFGRDEVQLTTVGTGRDDSPVPIGGSDAWNKTAWRVGVDYALGETALLFASIATGFKSGGFVPPNPPAVEVDPFAPEEVLAYEAGLNLAMRGRATLRAAAFYYDFTDLQVSTTAFVAGGVSTVTDNASKARIYGLDLAATVPFGERWSVSGGAVWLPERRYLEFVTSTNTLDVSGNYLSRAPEWSVAAALDYRRAFAVGILSARLDASYRSEIYFTRDNVADFSQDGFGIVNLYLRYEARSERWYLYASGRNLADESYFTQVFLQSAVGMPRNWEMGFGLRY